MATKTIFDLTDVGDVDKHGATELVKFLFQAAGRDIVSIRRNTHVSYMAVERARDIVKAIDDCIVDMESGAGDWSSYDKFSEGIEPLEDMLFNLLHFADEEQGHNPAKPLLASDCISLVDRWASEWEEIFCILNGLYAPELLNLLHGDPYHQEAQSHYDKTLLEELMAGIKDTLTKYPNKFPSYVLDVKCHFEVLQDVVVYDLNPDSEWLRIFAIKISILVEGVIDLVTNEAVDLETRNHLKSKPVWDAARALIQVFTSSTTDPKTENDANDKYNDFLSILGGSTDIDLPGSYADLMKKVGHIRRPFQAQAINVVGLCRFLAHNFACLKSAVGVIIENFFSLEESFNITLMALDGATYATAKEILRGLRKLPHSQGIS